VIVVLVASLAFGLALVMTGVTNQLSNEGTNTVALFGADEWVVANGVKGPFTTSQLISHLDKTTLESISRPAFVVPSGFSLVNYYKVLHPG